MAYQVSFALVRAGGSTYTLAHPNFRNEPAAGNTHSHSHIFRTLGIPWIDFMLINPLKMGRTNTAVLRIETAPRGLFSGSFVPALPAVVNYEDPSKAKAAWKNEAKKLLEKYPIDNWVINYDVGSNVLPEWASSRQDVIEKIVKNTTEKIMSMDDNFFDVEIKEAVDALKIAYRKHCILGGYGDPTLANQDPKHVALVGLASKINEYVAKFRTRYSQEYGTFASDQVTNAIAGGGIPISRVFPEDFVKELTVTDLIEPNEYANQAKDDAAYFKKLAREKKLEEAKKEKEKRAREKAEKLAKAKFMRMVKTLSKDASGVLGSYDQARSMFTLSDANTRVGIPIEVQPYAQVTCGSSKSNTLTLYSLPARSGARSHEVNVAINSLASLPPTGTEKPKLIAIHEIVVIDSTGDYCAVVAVDKDTDFWVSSPKFYETLAGMFGDKSDISSLMSAIASKYTAVSGQGKLIDMRRTVRHNVLGLKDALGSYVTQADNTRNINTTRGYKTHAANTRVLIEAFLRGWSAIKRDVNAFIDNYPNVVNEMRIWVTTPTSKSSQQVKSPKLPNKTPKISTTKVQSTTGEAAKKTTATRKLTPRSKGYKENLAKLTNALSKLKESVTVTSS